MKKLLSLTLVLTLLVTGICALASCEAVTAASAIKKADEALLAAPYVMTMSMDFECDNAEMNAVFDALSMEIPVTVDGDNLSMNMSVEAVPGMTASVAMTVVDKVLYYNMSVAGQTVKMKATMTEEQYADFQKDNQAEMPVDPGQFENLTLEKVDGKHVVTCEGITEEGRAALNEILGEATGSIDAEATIDSLSYVVTIADDKYESMALSVAYSFTVAGETFTTTMTMNAKFAYTDVAPITAPADADSYTEADINDLLG